MQPQQASPIHEFGEFELDTLRRVLTSRATGQPVDITGRVVEALVYLVERPGQLVEKKALMDALWPHVVVEEGNLTQTIHSSVRKAGERVRITAQLIDGATSAHVWSDTYDRDLKDIFGVQSEIAAAVADALHVTINRAAPTRAETSSTQAYEHYLQGRHLFHRRSTGDLLQARSHFEKALEIDPEYGRAWTALAGVYMVARYEGSTLPDAMANWKKATERAVATSPELAEAHFRTAQYFWHAGDEATAAIHLARAKALNPQEPLVISAEVSRFLGEGRFDEAIELQKTLVALDPLSATNRGNLGVFLMTAGRLQEAQAELERSLELSPAAMNTLGDIAQVLILQGRADEAMSVISRMREGYAREQRFALAYYVRGDVVESDAILARLIAEAEERSADLEIAVAIAEVYAARNDRERAFAWLDTAHRRAVSQPGFTTRWWLYDMVQVAPFLKPLRDDPRWARLHPKGGAGK